MARQKIADMRFEPDLIECPKCPPSGCNLDCCFDADEPDPQLWEGDQA